MSDITIKRSDTLDDLQRTFLKDGSAEDLTGATVTAEIREGKEVASNLVETMTVNPIDLANGVVGLSLTSAQTANMAAATYYYDIKRDIGGDVLHSATYKFTIEARVTA